MTRNPWLIRDVLMLLAMLFMAQVFILMAHKVQQSDGAIDSPGQLSAFITWPDGNNDIDLWVTGPGEPHPVGYSAANGRLWNLLRDDLGQNADLTPGNFENAFTRGEPDGLYVVNVHCYRCSKFPIPVNVELREKSDSGTSLEIATATVTLEHDKQEATAFQFLVSGGKVDPTTVTRLFASLIGGSR